MANQEYADAGVDSSKIVLFKNLMVECGRKTLTFPNKRGIHVRSLPHAHGTVFWYKGGGRDVPIFVKTTEGLGNKVWIAEWMYMNSGTGDTYYDGIGEDAMMMAVNDALAHGGLPVIYVDEVAAGSSDWFADQKRGRVLAESYYRVCKREGIALPAGESPSLRYLIKAELPVKDAPVLSGTITSIVSAPHLLISGDNLQPGLDIIGVTSSGIHSNGISLVIKKALELPDQFLTKLDTGRTLGEEALIPTRSYVKLIEALQRSGVEIQSILPGTGDGVAKLASDKRKIQYRIHTWLPDEKIPFLFRFMRERGVSLETCLKTFNWGIGYYLFTHPTQTNRTIDIGTKAGYEMLKVGVTEDGPHQTIFGPAGDLVLPPP